MAIQVINIGSSANKGDGDPLRTAFKKINENFAELNTTNTIRDIKGSVFGDDSTLLVDGVNSLIPSSVLSGNLPAIDGSALTGITVNSLAFSNITSKPTTVAGYGITDAYTKTEVDNLTTTLDGDFTGSVFGDDSTLLVDGINNKIVGAVDTTSLRTSDDNIALGNSAGFTNQGAYGIALGFGAGDTNQGIAAIGIGYTAGQTSQGGSAIAIGQNAGNTTQGIDAVAIGVQAGLTTQGASSVAIGQDAGQATQGISATAIGQNAGKSNQGGYAVAIGHRAGETNQAANSIVINATGVAVNNIVADTFVVKPVREVAGGTLPTGFKTVGYNPTTGEFIYLAGV
jgi:hypothetical protein